MKPDAMHHELTDALREELSLFVLGLLEGEEAARLYPPSRSRLRCFNQEFTANAEALGMWSSDLQLETPSPELKERLMSRIRSEAQANTRDELPPGFLVVRSGSAKWRPTPWDGISYIKLFLDKETGAATSLVRVEPGARYPAHRHRGLEQSWVVEGSCRIGSISIRAGDYACAYAGTEHGVLVSDEGCVLLVMSSERDEILA